MSISMPVLDLSPTNYLLLASTQLSEDQKITRLWDEICGSVGSQELTVMWFSVQNTTMATVQCETWLADISNTGLSLRHAMRCVLTIQETNLYS